MTVGCAEVRDLIHPFLDGELEVEKNVELLKHFELCSPCNARKDAEGKLQTRIEAACCEPLADDACSRMLSAAFARAERSDSGVLPVVRRSPWRRSALLAAAAVLVAVGAGWLGANDPFCWQGCPTERMVQQAYVQAQQVSLTQVQDGPELEGSPRCAGMDRLGFIPVETEGCYERPMVVYQCRRSGRQVRYFHIPGGHLHSGQLHEDGRRYAQMQLPDGTQVVTWQDRHGGVSCCLPGRPLDGKALLVMATALRDSE